SSGSYARLKSLVISIASGRLPETLGRIISPRSALSAWKWRLTSPGSTRRPPASMVSRAVPVRRGAIASIRPLAIATSTSSACPRTRALRTRRSRLIGSHPLHDVQAAEAIDQVMRYAYGSARAGAEAERDATPAHLDRQPHGSTSNGWISSVDAAPA